MTNSSNTDYNTAYYEGLLKTFTIKNLRPSIASRIGELVIETTDLVLRDGLCESDQKFKDVVLNTFLNTINYFPNEVEKYLISTLGKSPYAGILNSKDADVAAMWARAEVLTKADLEKKDTCLMVK